ncbi:uncharacterized protein LOC114529968 [Dendronephthya gigantea]|uniref:uncharacterized protein LOC114529968 n=1 Tax=Dendronephthya gigantea TaxID=151771 RepID=UPI00106C2E5D|nr:uncharacterized protein LOC114529968 [Dendronephthya gigantea]
MRVKLAVQVLNSKVQKDMAKYENEATKSTQQFISNCDALWNVFNDTKPLSSLEDTRIKALDDVLDFFKSWKNELASIYALKSEISSHFISWQTMFDIQVTINGFKALVKFIGTPEFRSLHGSPPYIIPKRISQDIVESFFSMQRQACGGTNNMTAYTYGYNVNSMIIRSEAKRLSKKQTNTYDVVDIEFGEEQKGNDSIPKRSNVQGIFSTNLWPVYL